MTEEPILKVSLKEYKQGIDDLRASLLTLESTSKEYQDTAEEIRDRQSKLNEVMSVGKKDVDAVAGSYNALSQEMSKLKKEWKNMEMGTQAWKDMAVRINEMNDRLKEADASVGVFSRNVGDYANAFSTAFEKSLDGLGKMDGMLGASAKTIKQLIPIIKQANSTAVKGLNGVKAALVSTGIGALIVGVGLLISNWDKLTKIFNKSRKENEKLIESEKTLNEKFDEQNRLLENEITVMTAQGKSTAEINGEKNKLIDTQLEETRATIQETKAKIEEIKAHSWLRRILTGENSDLKGLTETLGELEKIEKKLSNEREKNNASTTAYYESQKQKAKERYEAEEEKVKELLKTIEDANKTEKQKLKEKYDEELALLKKHHKSTKALTEKYNKDLAKLEKDAAKERADAENAAFSNLGNYDERFGLTYELRSAQEQLAKFTKLTNKEFPPQGLLETIKAGEDVTQELTNMTGDSVKLLEDAKGLRLVTTESANEFAAAWIAAGKRVQKAKENIVLYDAEMYANMQQSYAEFWDKMSNLSTGGDRLQVELEFEMDKLKNVIETLKTAYEKANEEGLEEEAKLYKNLYLENVRMYDDLLAQHKARQAELNTLYYENLEIIANTNKDKTGLWNTAYFDKMYQSRINSAKAYLEEVKQIEYNSFEERTNAIFTAEQNLYDIQREYNEAKIRNYLDFANSVSDIFGSIGSIYEENINHQKEMLVAQGKTDEEANAMLEDKFKVMKAFQIAQATINTISGAITAFMESQKLGQPWGTIIGATQAAAVITAGIAQIQKIRNTSIGNTQAPSAIPSTQLPNVAEYNPQNVQNVTSASDEQRLQGLLESTNIVVNVSDIDRAQKRVRVRDGEASF